MKIRLQCIPSKASIHRDEEATNKNLKSAVQLADEIFVASIDELYFILFPNRKKSECDQKESGKYKSISNMSTDHGIPYWEIEEGLHYINEIEVVCITCVEALHVARYFILFDKSTLLMLLYFTKRVEFLTWAESLYSYVIRNDSTEMSYNNINVVMKSVLWEEIGCNTICHLQLKSALNHALSDFPLNR